jgi:hypothetical protein
MVRAKTDKPADDGAPKKVNGLTKPMTLSPALAAIVGAKKDQNKGGRSSDCPILRYRLLSADLFTNFKSKQSLHRFKLACLEETKSLHRFKMAYLEATQSFHRFKIACLEATKSLHLYKKGCLEATQSLHEFK